MPSTVPKFFGGRLRRRCLRRYLGAGHRAGAERRDRDTRRYRALPRRAAARGGSPLAALTKDPGWAAARALFRLVFGPEDATRCQRCARSRRSGCREQHQTMLYMFSGPDFLYAVSFSRGLDICTERP